MNAREQMLDELGKRLTQVITATQTATTLKITMSPLAIMNNLLECKNLVNKLKGKEESND